MTSFKVGDRVMAGRNVYVSFLDSVEPETEGVIIWIDDRFLEWTKLGVSFVGRTDTVKCYKADIRPIDSRSPDDSRHGDWGGAGHSGGKTGADGGGTRTSEDAGVGALVIGGLLLVLVLVLVQIVVQAAIVLLQALFLIVPATIIGFIISFYVTRFMGRMLALSRVAPRPGILLVTIARLVSVAIIAGTSFFLSYTVWGALKVRPVLWYPDVVYTPKFEISWAPLPLFLVGQALIVMLLAAGIYAVFTMNTARNLIAAYEK